MNNKRIKSVFVSFLLLTALLGCEAVESSATTDVTVADDFASADKPLFLVDYTTNNTMSLPDVRMVNGRYRAYVETNARNITLHFKKRQGRLDAKLVTFPFDYIARNIGIGTVDDSQVPPPGTGNPYIFAGIQVHVRDLASRNSSHLVVGHRGGRYFTVEGKNTVNGVSSVSDEGKNVVPDGRADLRIVGSVDTVKGKVVRTLTVYWQQPNLTGDSGKDDWVLYGKKGKSPGKLPGKAPDYDDSVYIGLITYAQGSQGIPFVGTCDAIEFIP